MDRLLSIGARNGIPVIEDAAEAIGSVYHGKRAGSLGRFGTFSFHGTKTITTGEGGMFVTNDPDLYERVLTLSNHGRARGQTRQFWPEKVGFKYKMSNVQAAIGCAQMERINLLISRKREIMAYYRDRLATEPGVSMNPEPEGVTNGAWMPTAVFARETGLTRETLLKSFGEERIDARVFFYPLSSLPMFEESRVNTVARDLPNRAINLPSYHDLTRDELDRVIGVIQAELNRAPVKAMG
jgi:perosamine synthetase